MELDQPLLPRWRCTKRARSIAVALAVTGVMLAVLPRMVLPDDALVLPMSNWASDGVAADLLQPQTQPSATEVDLPSEAMQPEDAKTTIELDATPSATAPPPTVSPPLEETLASPLSASTPPPHLPLPDSCISGVGFNLVRDTECFFAVANQTRASIAADPHGHLCWGNSGWPPSTTGGPPASLLFHTAALTSLPPAMPLLLHSFLATQCCDAQLWFWLPRELLGEAGRIELPAHQAHRIVWKLLDVGAEWAGVAADFPGVNASTVAAMSDWKDLRFVTDWMRLLLMYVHGGTWFDIDTGEGTH